MDSAQGSSKMGIHLEPEHFCPCCQGTGESLEPNKVNMSRSNVQRYGNRMVQMVYLGLPIKNGDFPWKS